MRTSSVKFDLNSLAEESLQQKLLDVEREYKEKVPIIHTAINESKRLIDISVIKNVPATKAILEQMMDVRKTILSTHDNKLKEIDSVIGTIDISIDEIRAEILKFEEAIEELVQIEKGNIIVEEAQILTLKSTIKEELEVGGWRSATDTAEILILKSTIKEELEDGQGRSAADTAENLTIRDCIKYMQKLESRTRENLEYLEEKKKKSP